MVWQKFTMFESQDFEITQLRKVEPILAEDISHQPGKLSLSLQSESTNNEYFSAAIAAPKPDNDKQEGFDLLTGFDASETHSQSSHQKSRKINKRSLVSIKANFELATEGSQRDFLITFRRRKNRSMETTVYFETFGKSQSGVDYLLEPHGKNSSISQEILDEKEIVFEKGEKKKSIKVVPLNDNFSEGEEMAGIRIEKTKDYKIRKNSKIQFGIVDEGGSIESNTGNRENNVDEGGSIESNTGNRENNVDEGGSIESNTGNRENNTSVVKQKDRFAVDSEDEEYIKATARIIYKQREDTSLEELTNKLVDVLRNLGPQFIELFEQYTELELEKFSAWDGNVWDLFANSPKSSLLLLKTGGEELIELLSNSDETFIAAIKEGGINAIKSLQLASRDNLRDLNRRLDESSAKEWGELFLIGGDNAWEAFSNYGYGAWDKFLASGNNLLIAMQIFGVAKSWDTLLKYKSAWNAVGSAKISESPIIDFLNNGVVSIEYLERKVGEELISISEKRIFNPDGSIDIEIIDNGTLVMKSKLTDNSVESKADNSSNSSAVEIDKVQKVHEKSVLDVKNILDNIPQIPASTSQLYQPSDTSKFVEGEEALVSKLDDYEYLNKLIFSLDEESVGSTIETFSGNEYSVDTVISDFKEFQTDFKAVGFIRDNIPTLVIQGSKSLTDWLVNMKTPLAYPELQSGSVYSRITNWLTQTSRQLRNNPEIIGHSQGGALAMQIAARYTNQGNKLSKLLTFNSPGITDDIRNDFNSKLVEDVHHYIVYGDIVSLTGETFLPGKYTMISWDDKVQDVISIPDFLIRRHGSSNDKRIFGNPNNFYTEYNSEQDLSSALFNYWDSDVKGNVRADWASFITTAGIAEAALGSAPSLPFLLSSRATVEQSRRLIGSIIEILLSPQSDSLLGDVTLKAASAIDNLGDATVDFIENLTASAWDQVSKWQPGLWTAIEASGAPAITKIAIGGIRAYQVLANGGINAAASLLAGGFEAFDILLNAGTEALSALAEGDVEGLWLSIRDGGTSAWNAIAERGDAAWTILKGAGSGAWDALTESGRDAWNSLSRGGTKLWNGLLEIGTGAASFLENGGLSIRKSLPNLVEHFKIGADGLVSITQDYLEGVSTFTSQIAPFVTKVVESVGDVTRKVSTLILDKAYQTFEDVSDGVSKVTSYGVELFDDIGRKTRETIYRAGEKISDAIYEGGKFVKDLISKPVEVASEAAELVLDGAKKAIKTIGKVVNTIKEEGINSDKGKGAAAGGIIGAAIGGPAGAAVGAIIGGLLF